MYNLRQIPFLLLVFSTLFFPVANAQENQVQTYRLITLSTDTAKTNATRNHIRQISNDSFNAGEYKDARGSVIKYRLLAPAHMAAHHRYPLVVILHGSGAIGNDNASQLGVLAKLWAQHEIRSAYPAFVLAPQFAQRSSNYVFDKKEQVIASAPGICLTALLELIDSLQQIPAIDSDRIYVIGFSMGGSTAVNAVGSRPYLFAAAISVSGIPDFGHLATLCSTPLWLIHGNADTENPMASDALLYKKLKATGKRNLRFWEIDHLAHDIYSALYTTDMIPKWLFGFKKK